VIGLAGELLKDSSILLDERAFLAHLGKTVTESEASYILGVGPHDDASPEHLFIDVTTAQGPYGVKLGFTDGLNVIRADNSMGKSTVMQAIVYSLGLEGMFGPSQEVPLAHAVTDYLEHAEGIADVLESNVYLEFENAAGQYFTVQRVIRGTRDRHLITLVEGRATTGDGAVGPSAELLRKMNGLQRRVNEDFIRS